VTEVNEIVCTNKCFSVLEIAEGCEVSIGSSNEILIEKLKMHRVAAKFVPRLMSQDQKDNRVTTVCRGLLDYANDNEMFMK